MTQDKQPGDETRSSGWSVSDATPSDAEPATRTARKATTSKRKTSSSRKTTKKEEGKPKTTARRKASKTTKENDEKPKTTAKPKTATKRKTSKSGSESKTTSKRRTTKKETGKTTTKRRSHRKQDLGDLISQLLERRASGEKGTDTIVQTILEHLTKNMGLSSDAAEVVVGYILDKLVKSKQEKRSAARAGEVAAPAAEGLDLSSFFQQTRSGAIVDITPMVSGEELQEMAQSAGLDQATAEASLGQVLKMLGDAAA